LSADAKYGVKYDAEERVLILPQDQGKWYVSLFGDPGNARYQELQKWFRTHPGLIHLRGQVHYNEYSASSLRYKQRYAKDMVGLPCVRVQNHQGIVASEFWAEHIPMTPDALYNGIREDILDKASWGCLRRRRCRPCPQPSPAPQPAPQPVKPEPVKPEPSTPPVLPEKPAKPGSNFPWWLAILSGLTGAGAGVYQGWRDTHFPEDK
jgi:hypothetical protein